MLKWWTFILALIAISTAADERKVREEFDRVKGRIEAMEGRTCTLMVVLTPSGQATICATK